MYRLTQIRREQGLSQSKLAREAGIHPATVSAIENGRLRPYPSQLEKIASALRVENPDELLEEVIV